MIASQKIGKSFMGALNYNLKKLHHPDPEMRAELLTTNFASIDPAIIKEEVYLMKSLKPNLSRYVYHTSINFPKEDLLDNKKLLAIAHAYLKESGYTNNQYMVFRHHDADHPHIHLLVNRISFDGTVVSDSNNFKKSEAILRNLEIKYGLTQVRDSQKAETKAVKKGELEMVIRTGRPSDKMLIQEKIKELLRRPNQTIPKLISQGKKEGIYFLFNQASTGRITGITYFHDGFKIKGQALGNQFKWAEIIKKVDYEQIRDSQAISEANRDTRAAYGQLGITTGNRTESTGRNNSKAALSNATEFNEQRQIDERIGGRTGKDMAEIEPTGNNSGTTESGLETAADTPNTDGGLVDNWGNNYVPPFAVQLEDDEDDALRRRKQRGIGR
jgi:hypothetical protein